MRILLVSIFSLLVSLPSWAAHGYALWGELKYPENFSHFDYVNPQAPKGGELRMVSGLRVSTFDKFNPFTMKGNAPAYLSDLMFDSLLAASKDETDSAYGLLAKTVEAAPDLLSVVFKLNPAARFHNGDPVAKWMLSNVALIINSTGLVKFDKRKSNEKIDGMVAAAMAIGEAIDPKNKINLDFNLIIG